MSGSSRIRTDLALEATESFAQSNTELRGVEVKEQYDEERDIRTTVVKITTENGAKAMGRPQVRYSGSILKYSFSEIRKEKEVVLLHIEENKKMEMSFRKLKPLRDMREIKGTIRQLMEGEIRLGNQEDYMQVTLTDEEEILDAIGKVRTVFPNVMQICLENRRYARQQQIRAEEQDILHQDPLQLFAEFYKMQNNIELEEEEAEKIKTIFEEVRQ